MDSIRRLLGREVQLWQARGAKIRFCESVAGDLLVFRCEIQKPSDATAFEILRGLKGSVANGLADIIIDEYEKLLVERLIEDNYAFLTVEDRNLIRCKALERLNGYGGPSAGERQRALRLCQRKSRVWAKLAEYLEWENEIVVEGFITFRLKEYLEEIFSVVESTAEDYLTEREYNEFLKVLRHFMEKQKIKAPEVHVIHADGEFRLLNENLQPVDGEVGRFLADPPKGLDLDKEDLIVSAIVTLAPQTLVWHGPPGTEPCYDLIQQLLGERFRVCPGCSLEHPEA